MHIYMQIHIHIYTIKWDRVYITPPKWKFGDIVRKY